ncbi:MAG: DUF2971 domain-containing protein, partial [Candidatus Kapaibacterium sp.]
IIGVDLDEKLYRIFPYSYFLDQIRNRNNYLRRPDKWDDPMENVLLKLPWETNIGRKVSPTEQLNSWFGQCWTRNSIESDQLWRIYAPQKDGVFVGTTAAKLIGTISDETSEFNHMTSWLRAIEYISEKRFEELLMAKDAYKFLIDSEGQGPSDLLGLKRESFRHENEVRLIHHDLNIAGGSGANPLGKTFPIDPNDLFEFVILDPRLSIDEASQRTEELRNSGYVNSISHSQLYTVKLPAGHKIIIWG